MQGLPHPAVAHRAFENSFTVFVKML